MSAFAASLCEETGQDKEGKGALADRAPPRKGKRDMPLRSGFQRFIRQQPRQEGVQIREGQDEGLRMLPFVQMPAAVSRRHVVDRHGPQARNIRFQSSPDGVQGTMGRRHRDIAMRIRSHRPHYDGTP